MAHDAPFDFSGVSLAVLNSLGEGVTLANAEGRIVFSNRAAEDILGLRAMTGAPEEWSEYYGVFLPDGTTPFPTDQYPLVRALRGEETNDVELFVRNANVPRGVLIAVTGRPMRDATGRICGAAVVFRSISALREAERALRRTNQELREAQRRQAELSAFIVHDLKSPLTGILGGVELLLDNAKCSAEDRECLVDIQESARSLHRMVLNLLDLHLADDGALVPELGFVDVGELLYNTKSTMSARAAHRRQSIEVAGDLPQKPVFADRDLLQRVLQNLVDNCVKYGPAGGKIWLDANHTSENSSVILRVRDEGPGVPVALRQTIFEKYAQLERDARERNQDSRGLGLRFCQVALGVQNGRIWVEDNHPRGACFSVELPVARAYPVRAENSVTTEP